MTSKVHAYFSGLLSRPPRPLTRLAFPPLPPHDYLALVEGLLC